MHRVDPVNGPHAEPLCDRAGAHFNQFRVVELFFLVRNNAKSICFFAIVQTSAVDGDWSILRTPHYWLNPVLTVWLLILIQ